MKKLIFLLCLLSTPVFGQTTFADSHSATVTPTTTTNTFSAASTTALANITGLAVNVVSGGVYYFRAVLPVTPDVTGGHKYAIGGTATATSIIYNVLSISNSSNLNVITSVQTALGGAIGQAGTTSAYTTIEGQIVVNAGGTLTVQFAQNVGTGTSTVAQGATFTVTRVQ